MAKRFSDTEIWDKQWFMALSPKLKCLVNFIRAKCDVAGIWQPNWMLAKTYIGEKVDETDLLKIDSGKQFKKLPAGEFFCIGFINFQYGELSEKCHPHRKIIALLKKYQLENDRVLLGYCYPTVRVQEEEKEEDKEKEEEEEKGVQGEKKKFTKPTKEEALSFLTTEKKLSAPEAQEIAEEFINFYESKGWMVGKNKMKNWRAAASRAINWEQFNKHNENYKTKDNPYHAGKPDYSNMKL